MKKTKLFGLRRDVVLFSMFLCSLLLMSSVSAQNRITGKIVDKKNEVVVGATILNKGTTTGTITDVDGNFSLEVPDKNGTIIVSSIGYVNQEISLSGRSHFNIILEEDIQGLDEVVVVGYGKQKKSSITGSVSAIKGDELLKAPSTNISQMLGGRVAGISSLQTSGEPGLDQASLRIRGAVNAVTYIVDGVPRDINEINPNDIESLSVLKDAASTAVYGLQAAGGVIVVTTKKGTQGKPTLTYDGSAGVSMNANFAEFMNATQFMNYFNMADMMDQLANGTITDRSQYVPKFTSKMMQLANNNDVADGYDNVNYIDKVFGIGFNTKHTLSLQGGNENSKYYASLGYLDQKGNIEKFGYNRYNLRMNLESKVANNWTINLGVSGYISDRTQPGYNSGGSDNGDYEAGYMSIAKQTISMHPYLPEMVDGVYTGITSNNGSSPNSPLASIYQSGWKEQKGLDLRTNIGIQYDLPWVKGLSAKFSGSYDYSNARSKNLDTPFYVMNYNKSQGTFNKVIGEKGNSIKLGEGDNHYEQLLMNLQLNYDGTFGGHTVSGLALFEMRDNKGNGLSAYAKDLNFAQLPELSYGTMTGIGGYSSHSRVEGFVVRGNYSYMDKYYAEFSGRYDGSYKFSGNISGKRWAFFPSGSIAWRLSREAFMENASDWLSDLKLRASMGIVGDDSGSAAYAFLSTYSTIASHLKLDGDLLNSMYLSYIANPNLTWAKTRSTNVGFDATFWNGLLGVEFDVFYNFTYDMLQAQGGDYPPSMGGYYQSYANIGKMDAKGIDVMFTHNNKFGVVGKPFQYSISGNISYAKNRWLKYPDSPNIPEWQKVTGTSIYANYGWVADGLYRTEEEIDNSPWYGSRPNVGDIKYVDLNGDGKINSQDRGRIGRDSRPAVTFGFNVGANWNGFDFNTQFTGGAKFDVSMAGTYYNGYDDNTVWTQTFKEGGNSPLYLVTNAWNIDNPNGTMPRLTSGNLTHGGDNGLASTFWFRSGNYLRMKSAQIGYTFPSKWVKPAGIQNLRIYVEGSNLVTWDNLPTGFDPESPEVNNGYYPQQRTFMGGLTLTF
ncbi:MAG: SusC/RagA family TonB-linked outer membrane protein [Breznakibacter sp.]